jgi:hypothetical protein
MLAEEKSADMAMLASAVVLWVMVLQDVCRWVRLRRGVGIAVVDVIVRDKNKKRRFVVCMIILFCRRVDGIESPVEEVL